MSLRPHPSLFFVRKLYLHSSPLSGISLCEYVPRSFTCKVGQLSENVRSQNLRAGCFAVSKTRWSSLPRLSPVSLSLLPTSLVYTQERYQRLFSPSPYRLHPHFLKVRPLFPFLLLLTAVLRLLHPAIHETLVTAMYTMS